MRAWISVGFAMLTCFAAGQSLDMSPSGYTLALPSRSGRLHLEAPAFNIVEASAKPSGSEFGLRGQDKADAIGLLVFLFQYPEEAPLTSEKCRDSMIRHVREEDPSTKLESQGILPGKQAALAFAQYSQSSSSRQWHVVRAFVASSDLCADIEFSSPHSITPGQPGIAAALASVVFDPDAKPSFRDLFAYATVLFHHDMMKAAAPVYEQALRLLSADDATNKWRRVATDQAVMAFGISGDLEKSRSLAEHAIQIDPITR
ncbi:MAG TPA: hypothetical protein VF126_00670 [Acidobacteriaceae bacterium]